MIAQAFQERELEMAPGDHQAYLNRGVCYDQMGNSEAAQADYERGDELAE